MREIPEANLGEGGKQTLTTLFFDFYFLQKMLHFVWEIVQT
jgi:hypothetical protein